MTPGADVVTVAALTAQPVPAFGHLPTPVRGRHRSGQRARRRDRAERTARTLAVHVQPRHTVQPLYVPSGTGWPA